MLITITLTSNITAFDTQAEGSTQAYLDMVTLTRHFLSTCMWMDLHKGFCDCNFICEKEIIGYLYKKVGLI